jgi:hypothetical protein
MTDKERVNCVKHGTDHYLCPYCTIDHLEVKLAACREALEAIKKDPHGCSLCHSGKMIKPIKGHQPDCGFLLLEQALTNTQKEE